MNILFFYALLLISSTVTAQESTDSTPVMSEPLVEHREFNPRQSHWFTTFAFEWMNYNKLPYSFDGVKKDFKESSKNLYGGRLGLGGEIYLGAGFMTSSRIEGFYLGTLFSKQEKVNSQDLDIAYKKQTGQILGGDAVQTLSFLFDMKTKNPIIGEMAHLTVEPFVLAGIGIAQGINKIDYKYDTTIDERYLLTIVDNITNSKIGAGINIISGEGFFLSLQATVNRFDITKRKTKGESAGGTVVAPDLKNPKMDAVTIYSIGGGYKF